MIKPIQMYTVICDNCGKDVCEGDEHSAWSDPDFVEEQAEECDWIKQGDKHYCFECISYDDNDNLVLKEIKETK